VQWLHNLSFEENKNKNACLVFLATAFQKQASNKCHQHTSRPQQFTAKKQDKLWPTFGRRSEHGSQAIVEPQSVYN
jgi:hypothetical protein